MKSDSPVTSTDPILVDAAQAARLCGISEPMLRKLHRSGRCPEPVRVGRCLRWRVADLRTWADAGCPAPDRMRAATYQREARQKLEVLRTVTEREAGLPRE